MKKQNDRTRTCFYMIDLKLVKIAYLMDLIFHNLLNYHNKDINICSILHYSNSYLCFASDSKSQFAQIFMKNNLLSYNIFILTNIYVLYLLEHNNTRINKNT